jgi:uroporphyrinogen decarboxylase
MHSMSSRERVLRAFDRVPSDRVPVDYVANLGIDKRMKSHFNLSTSDDEGLLKALDVDFRNISVPYAGPRTHPEGPEGIVVDEWGMHRRWIANESGGYWDFCTFPLTEADEEAVANWALPDPDRYDYSQVEDWCRRNDEYAQCLLCYGDLINGNGMLRGMEQTLIDLLTDEPAGLLLADRRFDVQLGIAERTLSAAKGRIDVFWMGEDLGTQDRPMISMETFRSHFRPRYAKLIDLAKSYGCRTMIHTCGSSSWVYDEFIDMGIEAVDTLQPECKGMSPRDLVRRFGGRLSFHGSISTAGSVAFGTVDQIREEVRDTLEVYKPTHAYMLSPAHALQDNSPTENVLALYEAARQYGVY